MLFVDVFLEAHRRAPGQIILDLDATDDPLHGNQEGRFFHGYYDCHCYLPLYVFCGRHLLAAKLRRSNLDASAGAVEEIARIVARIRRRWPKTRILLRGDSGFAREALMAWCEANRVDFLFGLARNERLEAAIKPELILASLDGMRTGRPARRFKDFMWSTLDSWSRNRRVVGKAEVAAQHLYEAIYCARGEMENRIKECQLDRFADRTSAATMRANQLRLWFASRGLRAALRLAPHWPGAHAVRRGDMRHHPPQAVEACRPGAHQRATHQTRHGVRLSLAGRVRPRSHPPTQCCRLTPTRHRTASRSPDAVAAPAAGLARPGCAAGSLSGIVPSLRRFATPSRAHRFACVRNAG